MKKEFVSEKLVNVAFSKTECGVDFYLNTGRNTEISGVLTFPELAMPISRHAAELFSQLPHP